MAKKKWIKSAIKKPGALRKGAPKTKSGTIKKDWLRKAAKKGGKTGQRARLALTLSKMRRKK